MRVRISALPALLLVAGSAVAQAGQTNAIRVFRSDRSIAQVAPISLITPAGNANAAVFGCLPADMLTYFTAQPAAARVLNFRALEFEMFANGATKAYNIPQIQIRLASQAPTPNQGRLIPDLTAAGLKAVAGPFNAGTQVGGSFGRWSLTFGAPVTIAFADPNTTGQGLCFMLAGYESQYGSAGGSYTITMTLDESVAAPTQVLSGFILHTGQLGWMDFLGVSSELRVTWFFEQSLIHFTKNPLLSSTNGWIISANPALAPTNPVLFGFQSDDGNGARTPTLGDWVSYEANGNFLNVTGGTLGHVWFVPLCLFEGDITGFPLGDPIPENWVGQGAAVENAWIHKMSLQKWLDDVESTFNGFAVTGTGATLNPANSTLGLWLGVDFQSGFATPFLDFQALVQAFAFSDPTNLPGTVGVEVQAYSTAFAPAAIFGRNITNDYATAWGVGENGALTKNQHGYTVITQGISGPPPLGPGGPVGIGQVPNNIAIIGFGFYMNCWRLDTPLNGGNPYKILDLTNIARLVIQ